MRQQLFVLLGIQSVWFGIVGCGKQESATVPVRPPVVTVSRPVMEEVTDYDEFTGRLAAVDMVDVRARVGGYLEKISFQPGSDVKENDVLFQIDPRPFRAVLDQAKAQLAQAQVQLRQQEIEVIRISELLKTQSATPIESDRIVAQRDGARAGVQAAEATVEEAQLNLDYTTVRAPISGRISRNYVDVGNLVMSGQGPAVATQLTTIVAIQPIYAYFDVDEQTVLRLRKRVRDGELKSYREADLPVYLGLATEEGFPHRGRIDFAENRLNAETGTLNVRAIFDNANTMLSPGLSARIRLQVGAPYQAVLLPEQALGSDQGQKFVLVVNEQNIVEFRQVKIGRLQEFMRVIQQGVSPRERVIVNGLQRVRPGLTVEPREVSGPQSKPAAVSSRAE